MADFDALLASAALPPALAREAVAGWQRIEEREPAARPATLSAPGLAQLPRVLSLSPFIVDQAIRNPAGFWQFVTTAPAQRGFDVGRLRRQLVEAAAGGDEVELKRQLRRIRNQHMLEIAWRDLAGEADLVATVTAVSCLADEMLGTAVAFHDAQLQPRYGTPRDEHGRAQQLLVMAMGKQGGGELNFSSDIDVIFCYPAGGETDGDKPTSNQQYFERLCKRVIALLNDVTEEGFVFRVDARLRPFGDSGPLAVNLAAFEQYLVTHARDWERYALIKARVVTGDPADIKALESLIRPFVYRRYLDFGALASVREMKAMIEDEVARQDLHDDVKRGAGGIREIEFIAQTFQLIRGGREPVLRERNLLKVLDILHSHGIFDAQTVTALKDAYTFLRNTEHRLQEIRDAQTHTLPDNDLDRWRVAVGMNFKDWPQFTAALADHRAEVGARFKALLNVNEPDDDGDTPGGGSFEQIWRGGIDNDRQTEILARNGYEGAAQALAAVVRLRDNPALRHLSREAQQRLDLVVPALLATGGRREISADVLQNLLALVATIARRSVYLSLLAEHPRALEQLVDLFAASPWIADHITRQPMLLDELLDTRVLFKPLTQQALAGELNRTLARHDAADLERDMETLRNFRHQQVLRVAASDIMGHFPIAEVSNHLSYIAETCIDAALQIAWRDVTARYGEPYCVDADGERKAGFIVVAYGKLGGLELSYSSDLDLVFLHDSFGDKQQTRGDKPIDNQVFFTRLAQRLIHVLTTPTPAGRTYEIDVRLRPSGASGLLVSSLNAFADYQTSAAWTWEHQALVRARQVAGNALAGAQFDTIRAGILQQARDSDKLRCDVREMRDRMQAELDKPQAGHFDLKQGAGGITDIEFMVQYGVLNWAHTHAALVTWTDNLRLLELFEQFELLPVKACRELHDAYFAMRREIHRLALLDQPALVADTAFAEHRAAVQHWWQFLFGDR